MLFEACAIFLSAFLLFAVQPLIAKIILPWFGGSAAVWSTCVLFFQGSLLGGYLYAHCSIRFLRPRWQAILHLALLAASLALLPILPSPAWRQWRPGDPSGRILLTLAATVGLPYFLLSATSPLLQAWYVRTRPNALPYRLFALSNFGSLLALLSFPVLVEPLLPSHAQAYAWSGLYVVFAIVCSAIAWNAGRVVAAAGPFQEPDAPSPTWKIQVLWMALAACASALLLGITNHLTQNVAPVPFLWVLPLSAYLVTFILCFERQGVYHRGVFLALLTAALGTAAFAIYAHQGILKLKWALLIFLPALFVSCMVCHGELSRLKPHPRYLTSFYLMVSFGGALGGLFVAIAAPNLFHTFLDLPIAMVACVALVSIVLWIAPGENQRVSIRMGLLAVALFAYLAYQKQLNDENYILSRRNFYGVLRVYEIPDDDAHTGARQLVNGAISHGTQISDPSRRRTPTAYYGVDSGMGRAIRYFKQHAPIRVGVIGLGAGVTASYGRVGDYFRFYEINPLDLEIASTWFTFLKDCPADRQVLLGDARLTMEQQASQNFDVVAVDAFSADAIPVHLLTREAVELYFRHLRPNGILAVHVSNRYLDLAPVIAQIADALKKASILVSDPEHSEDYLNSSEWVLVANQAATFEDQLFRAPGIEPAKIRPGLRGWTDDYSNLFQILK